MNDHPYIGIDAIILNDKNEVLLLKRKDDKKVYPGLWNLPSGFVEWNEEVKHAVIREVLEETSLKVSECKFIGKYYDKIGRHPTKTVICLPHLCKVSNFDVKINQESSDFGWFSKEEIEKMKLAFDHNKMLNDFFDGQPNN